VKSTSAPIRSSAAVLLAFLLCACGGADREATASGEHRTDRRAATSRARPMGRVHPAERGPVARLVSWNLRRLGHGRKRMDLVARVLASRDLAVIQEVMTQRGVDDLLAHLPGWAAVVSQPVGRGGYAERYAVLYRRSAFRVLASFSVDDPSDEFARDPYVVCLKARAFDFCLLTVHVIFGRTTGPRNAEVEALGPLLDRLQRGTTERDWIVAGDFNRPASAACWSPLTARGWSMTTDSRRVPTSLGARGYRSDYDHLLINRRFTREWTRQADRIDSVRAVCGGDFAWCLANVSDHAPVFAAFSLRGPDDD
jgi:endonuclease/exonuclease/phosphatase family metal-dependent hydrolase